MLGLLAVIVGLVALGAWASRYKPTDWDKEERNYFLERHRKEDRK